MSFIKGSEEVMEVRTQRLEVGVFRGLNITPGVGQCLLGVFAVIGQEKKTP